MTPAVVTVLPIIGNDECVSGFRCCAPTVPGCVIRLQDPQKAAEIVSVAVKALIEDEEGATELN